MKTKLYAVITLLTFVTLFTLSNGFAQDALSQPSVRLIYFLPNDRPARPDRVSALCQLIKDTQEFYADEMERHGFGRKTFRIETDKDGEPLVHHIDGKFTDAHYQIHTPNKVWTEIKERFDTPQHVYFCAIDISSEVIGTSNIRDPEGESCGDGSTVWHGGGRELIIPASGHCFNLPLVAHELGHGFELEHDFRDNAYIMSYGWNRHQLSKCAAGWLDAHRCFNASENVTNPDATIQMPTPTAAPNGIRLRFEINNPERLHQAQLLIPTTSIDPAPYFKLDGCHFFETENNTIEFLSTELFEVSQDEVALHVIDKHGHTTWQTFSIDIAPILPSPTFVSIPDRNLASALRKALKLAEDARIPERNLRRLIDLDARKSEIKNLTGLEQATQLRLLELRENQIVDIRPLANLKNLEKLILDDNNVRDTTPLAKMTQLTWLLIGGNPISDFAPLVNLTQLEGLSIWNSDFSDMTRLANMTQLKHLWLGGNKITDITPLANMTQLKVLYLPHNRIANVTPLAGLANLETLHLQDNSIRDIHPLANLTKLIDLRLEDNQISDVSPLAGLVNLEALSLIRNPIKNRRPLLAMLRRNPEIKIYLKADGDPLPVSLSRFRAELIESGVIIKWVTESELDNAGFNILRSETRDGEFKIVNPTLIQGAGTTSERRDYTWTDTTAKPNVAYYYRIEDVSHAGVRAQLATVRLRGLVSASGKLTTRWADLKRRN
ncbi:MAG: leucine-rich repeat domain-containing protein [Candidatus Poribacteria bacterium]|nr:leucine-rich repeat domain-containing protein [Candidatus Poribacteria bacterium]